MFRIGIVCVVGVCLLFAPPPARALQNACDACMEVKNKNGTKLAKIESSVTTFGVEPDVRCRYSYFITNGEDCEGEDKDALPKICEFELPKVEGCEGTVILSSGWTYFETKKTFGWRGPIANGIGDGDILCFVVDFQCDPVTLQDGLVRSCGPNQVAFDNLLQEVCVPGAPKEKPEAEDAGKKDDTDDDKKPTGEGGDVEGTSAVAYGHHFAPMHGRPSAAFTGPALFGDVTGGSSTNFAGFGDALRVCYGLDTTQGGQNEGGTSEVTWSRIFQAWAPQNAWSGVNAGIMSVTSAASSSLGGDACMGPYFPRNGASAGHKRGVSAEIGRLAGTAALPFPVIWQVNFAWGPTAVHVPNLIGTDVDDPGIPGLALAPTGLHPAVAGGNPLLANVIFEVQGPINGPGLGIAGNQYYLASTLEWAGLGSGGTDAFFRPIGTGGVTNGNAAMGADFGGLTADITNALSHSRIFAYDPGAPTPWVATPAPLLATPLESDECRAGRVEFAGGLAFDTPNLWARHSLSGPGLAATGTRIDGAGGPDWRISAPPLSVVDLRVVDHESGAIGNANIYSKVPASYSPPSTSVPAAGFLGFLAPGVPCVFAPLNRATFLCSVTGNLSMLQGGMTNAWDTVPAAGGGPFSAVSPGSTALGGQPTLREGVQGVPIIVDAATFVCLGSASLTFGTPYTPSDDFFLDGPIGAGGTFFSSLFEGGFRPQTSGVSELKPKDAGVPISTPDPSLAGVRLYYSASSGHFDLCASKFVTDELTNALTVNLQ